MEQHPEWSDEILSQLDAKAREYDFPVLNNVYFCFLGVDLRAFRSDSEWLIAFQLIVLEETDIVDSIYAFGNRLKKVGHQYSITAIPHAKEVLVVKADTAYSVVTEVHGRSCEFSFDAAEWNPRGATIDDPESMAHVFRLAFAKYRSNFLISDADLLRYVGRVSSDVERFASLTGWIHPDIAGEDEELPSTSPSFRVLAEALASGVAPRTPHLVDDNLNWARWRSPK